MNVLMRPDEETLAANAIFFAGNTSSPVIHRIETAGEHIQALYWVRETWIQTKCSYVTVRRNVLSATMEKSDWCIRRGICYFCDVHYDNHLRILHQQVPQVRNKSLVT